MRTKILTIAMLLIAVSGYSQTDNANKKDTKRFVTSHIKSMAQTAYKYEYDYRTNTRKITGTGVKVATQVYNTEGNTIEEVDYDENGIVSSKTTSKYDARGNIIETTIYSSDGSMQGKVAYQYNADTMTRIKVYKPDGSLDHENYCKMKHDTVSGKNVYTALTSINDPNGNNNTLYKTNDLLIFNSDSTLFGCNRYVYDSKGNLVEFATWKFQQSSPGRFYKYGETREVYSYGAKGYKVEIDDYNGNGEWISFHKMKYNENGYLIEDQQQTAVTKYKCDAHGNFIEAIMYDGNNNPTGMYKYTYQYFQ